MNQALVDRVVAAVLYEGYILYPYRPSVKNHQRWTFGGVLPRSYCQNHEAGDSWFMQTECLVLGNPATMLELKARFLHLMDRTVAELVEPNTIGEPEFRPVDVLEVGDRRYQAWQEAVERDIVVKERSLEDLSRQPYRQSFSIPGRLEREPILDSQGSAVGALQRRQHPLEISMEVSAARIADGLFKVTARLANRTDIAEPAALNREQALLASLVSTHIILGVRGGEFVSLTDPPERWREAAAACANVGAWPVLVGEADQRDTMLSAPIILYDYPEVAPESPGDLFDCTEIDEILTLRILTLTEEEKRAASAVDERARALLQRTEALARDQLVKLHGTVRSLRPVPGGE